MHITINTFGTRGDVQPYIALGKGLQQAGHSVCIFTHKIFEPFVRQYGLDFYPIHLNPREVLLEQAMTDIGNNLPKFMRWLRENYHGRLEDLFRGTDEASRGADLLINSVFSFAGYHVAQKHQLPVLAAYLQPGLPTRNFHSTSSVQPPNWLPLKGTYNYLSTRIANQMFFQTLRPLVNECRKDVLGLGPLSFGYYWRIDTKDIPILFGYSPAVLPKPKDWGSLCHVTGYWFLDQSEGYEPPAELVSFLEDDQPPVYIGFGSMVDHEKEEITRLIVEALKLVNCRGILLGGWSELGSDTLPETILKIDYAPHDWLFPQMAAVIHHGGAGTTAAGLRAGVPNIVVPFFADQFFWGWRVAELGAGPEAIPRKSLTAEKLANALRVVLNDEPLRERAVALGRRIRSEDGVARAIERIEHYPFDKLLI